MGNAQRVSENDREKSLQESVRIAKPNGVICFLEPNENGLAMVRGHDPSHPESANPTEYTQGLALSCEKRQGALFDSFIFRKERRQS